MEAIFYKIKNIDSITDYQYQIIKRDLNEASFS